jgi:leucyl aminopeptidase (aminopeptidase T)
MDQALAMKSALALTNGALRLRLGEEVAVLVDNNTRHLADLVVDAVREAGAEPVLLTMKPRTKAAEEPPRAVAAALASVDAAIMPVTFSLTHTKARNQASESGVRILSLNQPSEDTFESGVLDVDYDGIAQQAARLAERLARTKVARIESGEGAVIRIPIEGRKVTSNPGLCVEPGAFASPPCLEVNVGPHEDRADGEVWVNGALVPGGAVTEPFLAAFRAGTIQRPLPGRDGTRWQSTMERHGDPNVFRVVELGIGLNPRARVGRGNNSENEGAAGAVHLGLGEGRTFGSAIRASTHSDIVVCGASLWLDDERVISGGQILV